MYSLCRRVRVIESHWAGTQRQVAHGQSSALAVCVWRRVANRRTVACDRLKAALERSATVISQLLERHSAAERRCQVAAPRPVCASE
jgi:hypothetical protein